MKAIFKKYWAFVAILAYLIAVSLVIWCLFDWLTKEDNSAHFRNIGLIVIALVGTPLAIWRTLIAKRNAEAQAKNVIINDRNSITDTFTKAIEQLGASSGDQPNMEVRMGAIYALEKLSQTNSDYYEPTIDILAGYVRTNAPLTEIKSVTIDVQTALTVIGRRSSNGEEKRIDLSNTCLMGANLHFAKLQDADLRNTNFEKADLFSARLNYAYLEGANLSYAELTEACLKHAYLFKATLIGTLLTYTDLQYALFCEADLKRCRLVGAFVKNARFGDTKNFTIKQLQEAEDWELALDLPNFDSNKDTPA